MDTAQWPQEIVVKPIEEIVATNTCPKPADQKKPRPQKEQALNCPRCHSINTKFCYYNNYSLTQPRYFCKTCRRYWTEGGSLRNIPVGGGSRKNKRSSVSCSSPSTKKVNPDHHLPTLTPPISLSQNCTQNPKIHEGQDLNLAFPNISELVQQNNNTTSASASASASASSSTSTTTTITTTTPSTSHLSALELLTGITSNSRGFHSFMPVQVPADPNIVHSTYGFPLQDFKPTLNFSLDHGIGGSGFASLHGVQETSGRVLFPFADLKQASSTNPTMDQNNNNNNNNNNNKEQQGYSTGYWTGMLGGGGSWFWGVSRRKGSFIPTIKQVSPWTKLAKEE